MERLNRQENQKDLTLEEYITQIPFLSHAYGVASEAHQGQLRDEGTPYINHPLEVTRILFGEWGIKDPEKLAAGLLHDTVEDTNITLELLVKEFGPQVARWVEGVSKLKSENNFEPDKEIIDKENIKKIFARNLFDPIVGVLKEADRLHNMRTLHFVEQKKQVRKAKETLSYVKMAESLGMWRVMKELEDLSLKFTSPSDHEKFQKLLLEDPRVDSLFTEFMKSKLSALLSEIGVKAEIDAQINSLGHLRHKMLRQKRFAKINDVVSFRIIVDESRGRDVARNDSYAALGLIRETFGDMEDISRFDDFFSYPTDNGYSAIQVTLDYPFTSGKKSVEIAITTKSKEEFNNDGVVSLIRQGREDLSAFALKLIFTPTGEVKFFKPEATAWDFAYSIENFMGAQAKSVTIDGRQYPMSVVLPNASTVKIEVGEPRIAPEPEAVNFVLKPAKKVIESQLAEIEDQKIIDQGKEKISPLLHDIGLFDLYDLIRYKKYSKSVTDMLRSLGCKRYVSNLYRMIGMEQLTTEELKSAFNEFGITKENLRIHSVRIEGDDVKDVLGFLGKTVGKYNGNIKPMVNTPDELDGKEIFKSTLLVQNLPEENIKKLKKALLRNPAIKKVTII